VITGFNTDIEHDGVVYHVQTEDKGLDTPIILSLVYVGGAILASKRAPYEDLIAEGFSDEVLSERLKRQHRLICAAINSGRIDDLKKMGSGRAGSTAPLRPVEGLRVPETVPEPEPVETVETIEAAPATTVQDEPVAIEPETDSMEAEIKAQAEIPAAANIADPELFEIAHIPSQVWSPPPKVEPPPPPPEPEPEVVTPIVIEDPHDQAYTVHDSRGHLQSSADDGLTIVLLDREEFKSGESRTMRVLVMNRRGAEEKPIGGIPVSIKILGTAFRPQIYSLKTDRDGVASVATQIPSFTSGRAAVLVRAAIKDEAAELRRVIYPGK
jgi:hypothetical protein